MEDKYRPHKKSYAIKTVQKQQKKICHNSLRAELDMDQGFPNHEDIISFVKL